MSTDNPPTVTTLDEVEDTGPMTDLSAATSSADLDFLAGIGPTPRTRIQRAAAAARTTYRCLTELWFQVRPVVMFTAQVAWWTLFLGLYRFLDLETMRENIIQPRPTITAFLDTSESVTRTAELFGGNAFVLSVACMYAFTIVLFIFLLLVFNRQSENLYRLIGRIGRKGANMISLVTVLTSAMGLVAWSAGRDTYLDSPFFFLLLATAAVAKASTHSFCGGCGRIHGMDIPHGAYRLPTAHARHTPPAVSGQRLHEPTDPDRQQLKA